VFSNLFCIVCFLATAGVSDSSGRAEPARADSLRADSVSFPLRLEPRGVIALAGDGRGQVREPAGLAADPFGRTWVSDAQLHRVQRFDREGRWLGESGALGSGLGEMRRPGAVVSLGAAHMAVLDRENRRVLAYDLSGRLEGTRLDLGDPATESGLGRVDPAGLASDRGGGLYLADPARERVVVFDASGRLARTLGGFGSRPGQFHGLDGVAATPRGELIASERLNARVQRLDVGGRPAATWRIEVEPKARGAMPVAVDDRGRVAVADEAQGRLWVFDGSGRPLAALTGLGRPRALAFAPDGTLLVAEAGPARVRRFALVSATGD
jgi:tripartite motif-containing protein 71